MIKKRDVVSRYSAISNKNILLTDNLRSILPSGKKGQVTIFIILGMILLLAVVLLLVLRKETISTADDEVIPVSKGKIEQFISACILKTGEEAMFRLGQQGGYIDIPPNILQDGSLHLKVSPFQVIPYWAYNEFTSIPSLDDIKLRIDDFIVENLPLCIFGNGAFQETYDVIEKTAITSDTSIQDTGVLFQVHWELDIRDKSGEKISEVINHVSQSQIKLKRVYEMATTIVEAEMAQLKLEDITQDLIALEHPELPVSGIELSCDKRTWSVKKAEQRFKDMLRYNLRKLKVQGSEFVEFPEEFPYYENHYVWNLLSPIQGEDVSVVFNYENNYPTSFFVTPTSGGRMTTQQLGGSNILSALCLQNWKFTYDAMFPVKIRVKDETTDYNFNTALTVHLVRNTPNRAGGNEGRPTALIDYPTDDDYCSQAKVPMTVFTWERVENNDGVFEDIPLNNVDISLTCLKYRCDMGRTRYGGGYQSTLELNFPYCVGGIMRGQKQGYKEDWTRVVTKGGESTDLYLAPLFDIPVSKLKVVKHEYLGADKPAGKAQPLDGDELALIDLKMYKEGKLFHQVSQPVGRQELEITDSLNFTLLGKADFTYTLDIQIFDDEDFIGGYKGNWTLPWDKLQTAQEIVFHAITAPGSEEETYALLFGLPQYSGFVPKPEIK